jgi:hypothetical protein
MKRLMLVTAGCAAFAALAPLGGATAQSGDPTGTLELVQLERETGLGGVDNPPRRRESKGDVFTINGRVRDASRRPAGTVQALFTQTGRRTAQGAATFKLAQGQIVIAGGLWGSGDDTLAIVGGTGAYTRTAGTVRVTERRGRTEFLFSFGG